MTGAYFGIIFDQRDFKVEVKSVQNLSFFFKNSLNFQTF